MKKMTMGRKNIKRINDIGIREYEFNYEQEKDIYCNLCFKKLKKKRESELDETLRFNYYVEWEGYIYNKYQDYDIVKLQEFSRYLNQRIRNAKPSHEYWKLCAPVLLTLLITEFPEIIKNIGEINFSELFAQSAIVIVVVFLAFVMLIGLIIFEVYQMMTLLWDDNTKKYFLLDYKKVIDKIIKKRKKPENTND